MVSRCTQQNPCRRDGYEYWADGDGEHKGRYLGGMGEQQVKMRIAELQGTQAEIREEITRLRASIARKAPPDQVLVIRDGEGTYIRLDGEHVAEEGVCDACGERNDWWRLADLHVPARYEAAFMRALLAEERELWADGVTTRVIVPVEDEPARMGDETDALAGDRGDLDARGEHDGLSGRARRAVAGRVRWVSGVRMG